MNKLAMLSHLKNLYERDENIIAYLKNWDQRAENTTEDIMISYDFQAGSYTRDYRKNKEVKERSIDHLCKYILENVNEGGGLGGGRRRSNFACAFDKKTWMRF